MSLQEIPLYETAEQLGLSRDDVNVITERLGRQPTLTELSMLSVEWSEHCSYRRSRRYFSKFPRTGRVPVLVGEDAGGIVIDDLAILFKVESHNHPSQVEPKHGAATGVGGIIRDIFASGARPIALLNSLRFGPLTESTTRRLLRGVVDGIQWYGNSIGIPTVGGEVDFHSAYSGNCLVNVMCVGIAPKDNLLTSKAKPNCAVIVLGAQTGRDGIGGCSVLASQEMQENLSKRPTVQIGDPYFGKCLIEATLEAASENLFVAIKDMGAAGLTCTTSEMSAAGGCGMEIEATQVPARETKMEAWEFMMSESQERALAAVSFENVPRVQEIFRKWGLEAAVIGKTLSEKVVTVLYKGKQVASLPTQLLVEPPPIYPEIKEIAPPKKETSHVKIENLQKTLLDFIAHPSLISKQWIYKQYDHMVQTNTVVAPGRDAAVLRVKGKPWGLVVKMEGNARYCKADPLLGAQYILAEAARNLTAVGGVPLAITDGLNFGNPDKPEPYGEFVLCMQGLVEGCHALGLPVVSGNVSFYNETADTRILPTPIIGMVGQCSDLAKIVPLGFQHEKDRVYLLGPLSNDLSGSLFLEHLDQPSQGLPSLDWELEKKVQETCLKVQEKQLIQSCHDVGQGGLGVALVECLIPKELGMHLEQKLSVEELFSETPSRFIVSVSPEKVETFEKTLTQNNVPFSYLGAVEGTEFVLNKECCISVKEMGNIIKNTLQKMVE